MSKKTYVLGVTGGVGAGKSTVLNELKETYGAYVIQADEVGRRLRLPGMPIYNWMLSKYGSQVLKPDKTIDSARVAEIAFRDEISTARINEASHPLIREAILEEIRGMEGGTKLIALEAALLSEGNLLDLCDSVWYIYVPRETRILRLMETRGYSRERCASVIRRQKTDKAFRAEADHVLRNDGTPEKLKKRIARLCAGIFSEIEQDPGIHPCPENITVDQ